MTRNLNWMDQALCAQTNPEIFFPDTGNHAEARKVCAACPVAQQCNDHAQHIENGAAKNTRWGTWAGQTATARARTTDSNQRRKEEAERRETILRLASRGMDADDIATHVGCSPRTVWRITRQYRSDLGEAA